MEEAGASLTSRKGGRAVTSRLNPIERTIISIVAYGIALLSLTMLNFAGLAPPSLVFAVLAVPLIIVSLSYKLRGGGFFWEWAQLSSESHFSGWETHSF